MLVYELFEQFEGDIGIIFSEYEAKEGRESFLCKTMLDCHGLDPYRKRKIHSWTFKWAESAMKITLVKENKNGDCKKD